MGTSKPPSGSSSPNPSPNVYGEQYREMIIRNVIKRARPKIFGWFDICPLNEAADILNIQLRNDAYRFLAVYHCVERCKIPREIRKRIPELIREALTK